MSCRRTATKSPVSSAAVQGKPGLFPIDARKLLIPKKKRRLAQGLP
jgi:hypothetical protein